MKKDRPGGLRTTGTTRSRGLLLAVSCFVLSFLLFFAAVKSFSKPRCASGTHAAAWMCFANPLTFVTRQMAPGRTALMLQRQTGGGSAPLGCCGPRAHLFPGLRGGAVWRPPSSARLTRTSLPHAQTVGSLSFRVSPRVVHSPESQAGKREPHRGPGCRMGAGTAHPHRLSPVLSGTSTGPSPSPWAAKPELCRPTAAGCACLPDRSRCWNVYLLSLGQGCRSKPTHRVVRAQVQKLLWNVVTRETYAV